MVVDDSSQISAKKKESIAQFIYNQKALNKSTRSISRAVHKKYNIKLIP